MPHKYRVGQRVRYKSVPELHKPRWAKSLDDPRVSQKWRKWKSQEGWITRRHKATNSPLERLYDFTGDDESIHHAWESELTPLDDKPAPRFKKWDRVKSDFRGEELTGSIDSSEWDDSLSHWKYRVNIDGRLACLFAVEWALEPAEPEKPDKRSDLMHLIQSGAISPQAAQRLFFGNGGPGPVAQIATLDSTEAPTKTRPFIRTRKDRIMSVLKALFLGAFCASSLGAGGYLYFVEGLLLPAVGCAGVGPLALLVGFIGAWVKHRTGQYWVRIDCWNCEALAKVHTKRGEPIKERTCTCPICGVVCFVTPQQSSHRGRLWHITRKPKES